MSHSTLAGTPPLTPQAASLPLTLKDGALALSGPLALGACVGLKADLGATATMAISLPLVLAGVMIITLPALYVSASMLGYAPRVSLVRDAALGAARDVGVMMLGLTPATLFVAASLPGVDEATVMGSLAVALCAMLGARAFSFRLKTVITERRALIAIPLWMVLSLGLGWQFYLMALRAGGLL